jgi:hypothetical protein
MAVLAPHARGDGRPRLWVLNLDAEFELASTGRYQTPAPVQRALEPWIEHARALLAPEDRLIDAWAPRHRGQPLGPGVAWCPTPSALERLQRAGAEVPAGPSLAVLQRVNRRSFYVELGGGAPGACFLTEPDQLARVLRDRAGAPWLFKRAFGFAGRGQRRILGGPSADDQRWLADSLRLGGVVAEPWLELEREVCLHGWLAADGELALGRVCVQLTDEQRAWCGSRRAKPDELEPTQTQLLFETAERVGAALSRAEYFGPFGIDAYLWRNARGALELNPLGELNARYTMGFGVGFSQS